MSEMAVRVQRRRIEEEDRTSRRRSAGNHTAAIGVMVNSDRMCALHRVSDRSVL